VKKSRLSHLALGTLAATAFSGIAAPITALHPSAAAAAAAHVEVDPAAPLAHSPTTFVLTGFTADCGAILVEFGDGGRQNALKVSPVKWTASHSYAQPGTYALKAGPANPCSTQPAKATVVVKAPQVKASLPAAAVLQTSGAATPPETKPSSVRRASGADASAANPSIPGLSGIAPGAQAGGDVPVVPPRLTVTPPSPSVNSLVAFQISNWGDCPQAKVDWGDGQWAYMQGPHGPTPFSAFHSYSAPGVFTVSFEQTGNNCRGASLVQATVTVAQ